MNIALYKNSKVRALVAWPFPGMLRMIAPVRLVLLLVLPFYLAGSCHLVSRSFLFRQIDPGSQIVSSNLQEITRYRRDLIDILDRDPETLATLNERQVLLAMSSPELVRREGPMRVLQYRSSACILDLFVTHGEGATTASIRHVEARARHTAAFSDAEKSEEGYISSADCVKSILVVQKEIPPSASFMVSAL